MSAISAIEKAIQVLEERRGRFEFVSRFELERAVFAAAEGWASYFGVSLSGFSELAREEVQRATVSTAETRAAMRGVCLSFAVKEKLSLLSTGDPYVILEGPDGVLEGKEEILSALQRELHELVAVCKEMNPLPEKVLTK